MSAFGKIYLVRGIHGSLDKETGEAQVFLIRLVNHGDVMGEKDEKVHDGFSPLVEIFNSCSKNSAIVGNGELIATFNAKQVIGLEFDIPMIFEKDDRELIIPTASVFEIQKWVNSRVKSPESRVANQYDDFDFTTSVWMKLASTLGVQSSPEAPSFKDDLARKANDTILQMQSQINTFSSLTQMGE